MSKSSNSSTGVVAGLLVGALAGLVLGLLYAPEEGPEVRKRIREKAGDLADQATDGIKNAGYKALEKAGMQVEPKPKSPVRLLEEPLDDIQTELDAMS